MKKYRINKNKLQTAVDAMELPLDLGLDIPKVVIFGDVRVIIENHRGIRSYNSDIIELLGRGYSISVTGRGLKLNEFDDGYAVVDGNILGVEVKKG